ncbi:hypothetical protein DWQ67_00190 [Galactobacter caseinivorans]|uniref:Uncharacterized protein n=1 Tax=Galactobacter caseinivorans TaxID=2676123 RepID=A0A496PLA2_9MICC|nr:hypothetical protein DWQ67_00190 [Galactobacter caseinivorans]
MVLVGGGDVLADAVVPVVAGAGVSLRVEDAPQSGWRERPGVVILWWAGLTQPPPAGAVLVDVDQGRLWAAAARAPGHRAVQLPAGRAWLAEHLGGRVGGGAHGPGRVLLVGGLGEEHHSAKVARELALAAHRGGMETVLVDADPRGSLRFLAVHEVEDVQGARAWWPDALAWSKDGAAHALMGALPRWNGVPLLSWDALAAVSEQEHSRWAGGAWPGPEQLEVISALARGTEVVVVDVGPLSWPLATLPGGSAAASALSELVLCAGHGAPWDEGWWLHGPGLGLPQGVEGSLVTVRSRSLPVDGPAAAAALGVAWAGTLDARPARGRATLRRSGQRMLVRHWLPRLQRGMALGAGS